MKTKVKHILFLDPISKLVVKKDSTLMLAVQMKKRGIDVSLLFEEDFFCQNREVSNIKVYDFEGEFEGEGPYLSHFTLKDAKKVKVSPGDVLHMRLDPPYDSRYQRYLWMLKTWQKQGAKVINAPVGIMAFNEKLYAYEQEESLDTFVGASLSAFKEYSERLETIEEFIMKPLDLYQGLGVEKIKRDSSLYDHFERKVQESGGAIVVQPFVKDVAKGEIRSLFFKGIELGTILKVPKEGEFLANIAQGASYHSVELNEVQRKACERICSELMEFGVPWVAFDILGDNVSEVNITCPGLLVEVSKAVSKNLADKIIDLL